MEIRLSSGSLRSKSPSGLPAQRCRGVLANPLCWSSELIGLRQARGDRHSLREPQKILKQPPIGLKCKHWNPRWRESLPVQVWPRFRDKPLDIAFADAAVTALSPAIASRQPRLGNHKVFLCHLIPLRETAEAKGLTAWARYALLLWRVLGLAMDAEKQSRIDALTLQEQERRLDVLSRKWRLANPDIRRTGEAVLAIEHEDLEERAYLISKLELSF
jgi:hypothetical protein